jgi:hypothetical protein
MTISTQIILNVLIIKYNNDEDDGCDEVKGIS